MKVIPSTYHQKVSYLMNQRQIDIYGDQMTSRQCDQVTMFPALGTDKRKMGPKGKKIATIKGLPPGVGWAGVPGRGTAKGHQSVWPQIWSKNVFRGDVIRRGKKGLIRLLRQNADVFAWKHSNVKVIHPLVACHHLNVKKEWCPVRQKLRKFHEELHKIIVEEVD